MPAALQQPTLVLNRNWQPIRVSTVARSLILVWNDHARIVDPHDFQTYDWSDWTAMAPADGELFIQAVTYRLRVPELGKVAFNRRNLFKRDHETCQYCGAQPGLDSLTIDHIMPRSRGGTSTWENCVLACIECNKRKADRTPPEARMKMRSKPTRPKWQPLYATRHAPVASWAKFISEAYWNVELEP
jgi:hypothetical protein